MAQTIRITYLKNNVSPSLVADTATDTPFAHNTTNSTIAAMMNPKVVESKISPKKINSPFLSAIKKAQISAYFTKSHETSLSIGKIGRRICLKVKRERLGLLRPGPSTSMISAAIGSYDAL